MKENLFFWICTIVFFLSIQFNFFHSASHDFFADSGRETSETLVTGRLLNTAQGNLLEDGGFTGTYVSESNKSKLYNRNLVGQDSHQKYLNNILEKKNNYIPYLTQIGGQAFLYAIFQEISPFDFPTDFQIFRVFNSLMLSFCLAGFLIWVKRKFSFRTAILTIILLLPNYWLFLYGRSIWWCNWVYFLPVVWSLLFFEKHKTPNFRKYVLVMMFLFFLKFWFTGFEFITTFLIAAAIPYLYYHFENSSKFCVQFLARHFVITAIPLAMMLIFLMFQFYWYTGSFAKGIEHLANAFTRRTSDGYVYKESMKQMIALKKYHLDIVVRYLGNSFTNPCFLGFKVPFVGLFLAGLFSGIYLYFNKIESRFVVITATSFLAPLSWLILFKEHAHIHTHIDFFLWYVPAALFMVILISLTINNLFSKLINKK